MLITVGIVTSRSGHKVHRHCNGWAACGAGKLIESPRDFVDGDQLCRRCAPKMRQGIVWEIDDMRARGCPDRAAMLGRVLESGKSDDQVAREEDLVARMRAFLETTWGRPSVVESRQEEDLLSLL